MPAEDDVEGCVGLEVRGQEGEVGGEVGGRGSEDLEGGHGLILDGCDEAEVGRGGEEVLELGDELLGGCGGVSWDPGTAEGEGCVPVIPDCILEVGWLGAGV